MTDLSRDPIINVIHNGIKRGIRVALENECWRAAALLTLSGIDTMAYLNMPQGQEDVTRQDFTQWADKYIQFPCKEQLTGLDLYGARCAMLHHYGTASKLSRDGKCREVGYMYKSKPDVRFNPQVSTEMVLVCVEGLAEAFFKGVDRFLIDVFADKSKAPVAEERFTRLCHKLPAKDNPELEKASQKLATGNSVSAGPD